jgi:hypothetical protein
MLSYFGIVICLVARIPMQGGKDRQPPHLRHFPLTPKSHGVLA